MAANTSNVMDLRAVCSQLLFDIKSQGKWKELIMRLEGDDAQHLADCLDLVYGLQH